MINIKRGLDIPIQGAPRQDIEDAASALQEALDATEEHLSQERS